MPLKKLHKGNRAFFLCMLAALMMFVAASCTGAKKKGTKPSATKRAKAKRVTKPKVFFREGTEAKVGKVAPAILAPTIKGKTISTTNCEDKITILNFWSIRCGPCIKEMPYLEDLYTEFKGKGLNIYAINTDQSSVKKITKFIEDKPFDITYDIVPDPDLVLTTVFTEWFVPVTIIIDSKGVLRLKSTGFTKRDYKKYRRFIKGLLNEKKS